MISHKKLRLAPLWWACAVGLTLYVVIECLVPARMVPDLRVSDKLEHAGAFWLMTFLYGGVLERRRFPLLIAGMLLLGAGIEIAQGTMGLGRDMDFRDWVADAVGVVAAVIPAYLGLDSWMLYIEQRLGLS
jgi:VanZ family protein